MNQKMDYRPISSNQGNILSLFQLIPKNLDLKALISFCKSENRSIKNYLYCVFSKIFKIGTVLYIHKAQEST